MNKLDIARIEDFDLWYNLVTETSYATYPALRSPHKLLIKYGSEHYLLPLKIMKIGKLAICESFGKNVDGGPIPLETTCQKNIKNFWRGFLNKIKHTCHIVSLTLRPWIKHHAHIIEFAKGKYPFTYLFPRILKLQDFNTIWKSMSKKARNRYRYFVKNGGIVFKDEPEKYVREILEINISSPIRQGRPLPKSYIDPRKVIMNAKIWGHDVRKGIASFYIAKLDGKIVGYAYIPHLNKHAYVARFMTHYSYMKYGVGNGLLIEIIKDLIENRKAEILQYGYWRNVNPGVNYFLKQHGFKTLPEVVISFHTREILRPLSELYIKAIKLSNVVKTRPPTILLSLSSRYK